MSKPMTGTEQRERRRDQWRAYNRSGKGLARALCYNRTRKGVERSARYEASPGRRQYKMVYAGAYRMGIGGSPYTLDPVLASVVLPWGATRADVGRAQANTSARLTRSIPVRCMCWKCRGRSDKGMTTRRIPVSA